MKTDWEYEQAVRDKLRLRRQKRRRARLTAGVLGGVLVLALSVSTAAMTMKKRPPVSAGDASGRPGSTGVSREELSLDEIKERLWAYFTTTPDVTPPGAAASPDDLTVEVLGELNGYVLCRCDMSGDAVVYVRTLGGYTFYSSNEENLGLYLVGGGVRPLEEAYVAGEIDIAEAAALAGGIVAEVPGEKEAEEKLTAYLKENGGIPSGQQDEHDRIAFLGTVGSYRVCRYHGGAADQALYRRTFKGYTFFNSEICSPSGFGIYLVGAEDGYGGVLTLEEACENGRVDIAALYHLLPESYQAGTPDTRIELQLLGDQRLRMTLEQFFTQEGCSLPADAAVREYGDILFVDTGVQDTGKYWTYGQQYGRALRCLVKDQPSKVGLYYYSSTTNELITIETALQEQKIFLPELYEILPEEMFVPVSYNPDHALTEEQSAALSTMVQYLAEHGASEEIPPPGSAVSTGIKAYDSINGCVVVKVDTVKNGVAAEVAIDGVVFRSEDTHAPYALGLYLVRGQEVLTLEDALDAGWATAKEVQFALPSDVGGTTPTIGPEGTPPAGGSTGTTDGPP